MAINRWGLTDRAEQDLLDVLDYIARDSIENANRVESAIYQACALLADSPMNGHVRTDLTRLPLRFWTLTRYNNYVIVYDPQSKPLQIIRILHGARNIVRELGDNPNPGQPITRP